MSDKKFLSWIGFKSAESKPGNSSEGSESSLERIRQLEAQLADLRARRDITSLTKEEFEILATETAMNLIKTAQSREAKAAAIASKAMNDATRSASAAINDAQLKVKELLDGAESRARKALTAAEAQAEEAMAQAQSRIESLTEAKRREAAATTATAKREAERMVSEATSEIANFRGWLGTAISETERLHRIQAQSLNAAEEAIKQTRSRLNEAFERLEKLGAHISSNLTEDNRPTTPTFTPASAAKKSAPKPTAKPAAKPATKPVAKPVVQPVVQPVVKKSAPAARKGKQTKRK